MGAMRLSENRRRPGKEARHSIMYLLCLPDSRSSTYHVRFANYVACYWLKSFAGNSRNCSTQLRPSKCHPKSDVVHSSSEPSACTTKNIHTVDSAVGVPHHRTPPNSSTQTKGVVHLRRTLDQICEPKNAAWMPAPNFFMLLVSLYAEPVQAQPVDTSMSLYHAQFIELFFACRCPPTNIPLLCAHDLPKPF